MTENTIRETVSEEVNRKFNAMLCDDLVGRMPDDALRQRLIVALCEKFGIPDPNDYSPKKSAMILVGCRLAEDAIADRDARAEHRGYLVGLVTEAIMACEGLGAGASHSSKPAAPASPASAMAPQEEAGTETIDISAQMTKGPEAGPERFKGAPPDLALFPGHKALRAGIPENYLSLLVPPPIRPDSSKLSAWFAGELVSPSSFSLAVGDLSDRDHLRMTEIEAEFLAAPKIFLERHGHLARAKEMERRTPAADALLADMESQMGETAASDLDILKAFRDAVGASIEEVWPEKAEGLRAVGGMLRTGAELMPLLRHAWGLEQGWLAEVGGALEGPAQNILGTPLPEGEMAPGLLFRRAAFLHLAMGSHMADALLDAAMDLRFAMVLRDQDPETSALICATFDEAVKEDCARPISSYRVAKNEMEPAL